ncbi:MAG: sensor histidine kinase [Planctomycetota bacterium]
MSLRLRLLLFIAAVNVGVLLLVVWLGTRVAWTVEPVAARSLGEAMRVAETEELPAGLAGHPEIRFVVRLPPGGDEAEGFWPQAAEAEVEAVKERLMRLVEQGQPRLDYDREGVLRIRTAPDAAWPAWYVAFSERAGWEALEGLRRIFILLGVGTLLLIAGTYLVLRKMVLRPLEQLASAARAVAEGRPPQAVVRPRGRDEVAHLVDNFNKMAAEVHEYQVRLEERVLDALGRVKAAENRLVVAQRLAATGTLAAGFAHEINNPLGGVLNAVRTLRERDLSPEKREEYFTLALDGLARIRTIVERILDFTPRRQGPTGVDIAEVCGRAANLALHRAERQGVRIDLQADDPVPGVVGDAQELTQAVLNLILNAIDAVPEGQEGTVAARARREGAEAILEVADDGVGMDAETVRRCVDLFFSTKPEGEGTGLGLAIVQHIVTDHGGALGIDSEKGRGTTVRIRLPIGPGE